MRSVIVACFFVALIVACVALGVASYVPQTRQAAAYAGIFSAFELSTKAGFYALAAGLVVAVAVGAVWLAFVAYHSGWLWRSAARLRSAEALRAERDASILVTVAPAGSQVYASSLGTEVHNLPIYHSPLHLAPGRVNGEARQPTMAEVQRWGFFQLTQSISKKPESALELPEQETQQLPEHVRLEHYVQQPSLRSVFLGVGRLPDGRVQPIAAPLDALVHIATGGASGFGKSTFMAGLAWQAINAREAPAPVLLDPQAVTFSAFAGDERLAYPLANEPKMIALILAELVKEMQRRQALFGRWRGIQNLNQYNQVVDPVERLPHIPVFFDEFGLIGDDKKVGALAAKLSAGGRKAGLSLVVGTQHWGTDSVSSAFRSNLSTAVQFFARGKSDSRILLGDSAAAEITRPGQAFARLPGQPGLVEMQAPDPGGVIDVKPELLPEQDVNPLAELMDRLDADEPESAPDFTARVVELHHAGESLSAISQQVFGYRNQAKLEQIKQILATEGLIG